ncbi:MAG: hypothetical protein WCK51_09955 [Armatimonadota bacterium]
MSDCVDGNRAVDGANRFAEASNLAPLYVSNGVMSALYSFRHVTRDSATLDEQSHHDRLLTLLVQEIRKVIGVGGDLVQDRITVRFWAAGKGK